MENLSVDMSADKNSDMDSELNLNILEEHFEELNVDPVSINEIWNIYKSIVIWLTCNKPFYCF